MEQNHHNNKRWYGTAAMARREVTAVTGLLDAAQERLVHLGL